MPRRKSGEPNPHSRLDQLNDVVDHNDQILSEQSGGGGDRSKQRRIGLTITLPVSLIVIVDQMVDQGLGKNRGRVLETLAYETLDARKRAVQDE